MPEPQEQPETIPKEEARLPVMNGGAECPDLANTEEVAEPRVAACEECGHEKVLRVCLTCGHVGCCESWRGHARDHAHESGHPLIRAWKGGAFVYCYKHGYQ